MPRAHVIETLSFEVDFGSEAEARDQHSRLGDFVAGRGLAVIGEVFDEFAGADEVLRLERLEVDLGETRLTADEAGAEQRLREAVRRALREALARRPQTRGADAQSSRADRSRADFEMVWGYLHHGHLSWRANTAAATSFDDVVTQVLEKHGEAFVANLRASPDRVRLLARMARQWPGDALRKLAALLSPANADVALAWALAPLAGQDVATKSGSPPAESWERLLLAMAAAPDPRAPQAADETGAPKLVVQADEREITDVVWSSLMRGEPADVRARLRLADRDAAWRRRLLAALTEPRWRQLLGQWGTPGDTEFFVGLMAQAPHWRLGAAAGAHAVARVLAEAMFEHLLAGGRDVLDAPSCVQSLVEARARMDGLAPDRAAGALLAGWPAVGPAARLLPPLRRTLGAWLTPETTTRAEHRRVVGALHTGPPSAAEAAADETAAGDPIPGQPRTAAAAPAAIAADERWRWRLEADIHLARAALPDQAWETALRLEPAWLAARLREHGRLTAWRRAFARALNPARLGEVLSLWAQPAEAAFILQLVETAEAWVLDTPHSRQAIGGRLREWLLDELLLAERERFDDAAVVRSLVRRRAEYDDLEPPRVARDLGAAWPTQGMAGAHRVRLQRILASLQGSEAAPPGDHGGLVVDAPPSERDLAAGRAATRARLEVVLAAAYFDADLATLVRDSLVADGEWLRAELRERGRDPMFRRQLTDALPPSLLFELAQPWLSETALRIILVAGPGASAAPTFWSDLFAALSNSPQSDFGQRRFLLRLLWDARPQDRAARISALRATRPFLRDASPTSARPGGFAPSIAQWLDRLPSRPSASLVRGLTSLLAPASAGLRQIADLDEGQRRDLLVRLRPAEGAVALEAIDRLSRLLHASGLPEPRESLPDFNWRRLLREFFEEGRRFEIEGFAVRWFTDLLGEAPSGGQAAWRAALLATLTAERQDPPAAQTPASRSKPHEGSAAHPLAAAPIPAAPPSGAPSPATERSAPPTSDPEVRGGTTSEGLSDPPPGSPFPATGRSALRPEGPGVRRPIVSVGLSHPSPPDGAGIRSTMASESLGHPSQAGATEATRPSAPGRTSAPIRDPIAAALERVPPTAQAGAEPWLHEQAGSAEPVIDDTLYVANAGIVLAGPYLPTLFGRLELTREGRFIDEHRAERAAHLLQFMADGGEAAAEHHLTLNKLLCGIDLAEPIGRDFTILDGERQAIEGLLRAILDRWTAVGRTSVAGLRESFFQRQGALTEQPESWRLLVEPRSFDMLLDQIPWGFSTLRFPWMTQVLHVDWR